MFSVIAKSLVKSKAEKVSRERSKKFLPWEKIEKIALIINQEDNINKSLVDKFIEDTKKYVEVYYVEINSREASFGDWQCLSKQDRSFLRLPSKKTETSVRSRKYDVVINACGEKDLYSAFLFSSLNASLKCASSPLLADADLVVSSRESGNLIQFLTDTVHYLKMIKA